MFTRTIGGRIRTTGIKNPHNSANSTGSGNIHMNVMLLKS